MKPILSILICTLPSRKKLFDKLVMELASQIVDHNLEEQVEVVYNDTNSKMTTGEKRNLLLEQASGEYLCFVDDDDTISKDYLSTLVNACKQGKDCVELRLQVLSNCHLGDSIFHFSINHGLEPKLLQEDVYIYPIGHLCPVKSEIAKRFQFPHKKVGEDLEWSRLIATELKTMATTDETLYFYNRKNK